MGSSHSTQANPEAAGFENTYIDVCGTADGELTASCERPASRDNLRVSFGFKPGVAMVKGFPSTGGVYILPFCSGMELDFLGLDRFEETPRCGLSPDRTGEEERKENKQEDGDNDRKEEDALCAKIRLLGARWWPSLGAYRAADVRRWITETTDPRYLDDKKRFFAVQVAGAATGNSTSSSTVTSPQADGGGGEGGEGVWVLEVDEEDGSERGLGRIGNARNMEEKCRLIERFGGTFYPDPRECPYLDFGGGP